MSEVAHPWKAGPLESKPCLIHTFHATFALLSSPAAVPRGLPRRRCFRHVCQRDRHQGPSWWPRTAPPPPDGCVQGRRRSGPPQEAVERVPPSTRHAGGCGGAQRDPQRAVRTPRRASAAATGQERYHRFSLWNPRRPPSSHLPPLLPPADASTPPPRRSRLRPRVCVHGRVFSPPRWWPARPARPAWPARPGVTTASGWWRERPPSFPLPLPLPPLRCRPSCRGAAARVCPLRTAHPTRM